MDSVTDDDLVRMYAGGDAEAFDVLFDRHYASVFRFAQAILGDPAAAEDVLQEAFLAAARAAATYDGRGRFRPWLMRIVRNRCLNRVESGRARRATGPGAGPAPDTVASSRSGPVERASARERREAVEAAIAELPERQREAIGLYAFEQMSYREIAEVMQMPVNTVKTLIHRARANLARELEGLVNED
ncbi:MAG TPA: sigma-70 family RNA polymerase sigma factor [Phycisphaerae bacterium]|nr:sigma-70 family RNA polymerase sigma factor [Phycisphaerae bacterium]